jgi:hypothetical protein
MTTEVHKNKQKYDFKKGTTYSYCSASATHDLDII